MNLIKVTILYSVVMGAISGQCTSSWQGGDSEQGTLVGWVSVTDYYGGVCVPPWTNFTHEYRAEVAIESPSGRLASNVITSSAFGGGGSAYAVVTLPILDEDGTYSLRENSRINCSVGGLLFVALNTTSYFAVGKARTTYGYDSPLGGCSYHKSCTPDKNHWAGDSYTSMPFNKPPAFTSCWNYVDLFHRFVKAGSFKRYWRIQDNLGNNWVGHDDWLACDGPLP